AVLVLERIFDVAHRKPARQHLDRQILKPLRVTLEMLPNGRTKRLIPAGNLWRRIFHQPLCRPQPSRAISIPVALAGLRVMLVVLASDHSVASPSSASSTISRVASLTSSSFAEAVESRPSINAVSSSRVCCEAGSLVAMGCSFAGLPSPLLNHTLQRMHPAKFPAILRLHRIRPRHPACRTLLNEWKQARNGSGQLFSIKSKKLRGAIAESPSATPSA